MQDGVHEREHRVVGGHAERQRQRGHEREPAILDQQANREAKIVEETHGVITPQRLIRFAHGGEPETEEPRRIAKRTIVQRDSNRVSRVKEWNVRHSLRGLGLMRFTRPLTSAQTCLS